MQAFIHTVIAVSLFLVGYYFPVRIIIAIADYFKNELTTEDNDTESGCER